MPAVVPHHGALGRGRIALHLHGRDEVRASKRHRRAGIGREPPTICLMGRLGLRQSELCIPSVNHHALLDRFLNDPVVVSEIQ